MLLKHVEKFKIRRMNSKILYFEFLMKYCAKNVFLIVVALDLLEI